MNKRGLLLLLLVIAIFAACGDAGSPAKDKSEQTKEETQREEAETVAEEEKTESGELKLGQTYSFEGFDVTIKSFSLIKDTKGNNVIKYVYDWKNTSDETEQPFLTFIIKGYQDGIEIDDAFLFEGIDLGRGQKDVKVGAEIKDCEGSIGIVDISKPVEIELSKLISFDDTKYTATIDPSTLK